MIGIELILLFYFFFNGESINEQITTQLNYWAEEHEKSGHQTQLEQVQNYVRKNIIFKENHFQCFKFTEN